MDSQLLITIGGSAAVGALVSSGITALAQWRERKSRREELLLTKAMEFARLKREAIELEASTSPNRYAIQDAVVMTEQYYEWLKHLMEHGALPDDPKIQRLPNKPEAQSAGR